MEFQFELSSTNEPPADGFDMGNLRVRGNNGSTSSRDGDSRFLMMVFIAAADLLDGLRRLIGDGRGKFHFVGVDSSFVLDFTYTQRGTITTHQGKELIDESDAVAVFRAATSGVRVFADAQLPRLPERDSAHDDLIASLKKAEEFLR